ncbi:hypothetical protein [Campylobacter concisus]
MNEVLKFTKDLYLKVRKVSNFTSQASNFMADTKPLLKFVKTLF